MRSLTTMLCVEACALLLSSGGRFDPEERRRLVAVASEAGGIWIRVLAELDRFLHDGAPWELSCAELEPLRSGFIRYAEDDAFERLWALALTNEPDGADALAAAELDDCPYRAALAFHALRRCLEDPAADRTAPIEVIVEEMLEHGAGSTLQNAYRKLLDNAVASVHAAPRSRVGAVGRLARAAEKLFDREADRRADAAWWQCGRLFLAEFFERHAGEDGEAALAAHPRLVTGLFDAPRAAVWLALHSSAAESLQSISLQADPDAWLSFLRQRIDLSTLDFEDRVRYVLARLKLLRARAHPAEDGPEAAGAREFLAAFRELRALLAHGVPPAHRALPNVLEPAIVDFYVHAVWKLDWDAAAVSVTEELLQRHPADFRIACLYATGVILLGEHRRLRALAARAPAAHVDPALFARCARIWAAQPRARQAPGTVRPLLFDGLDREYRKQCLLELDRQALRRSGSAEAYAQELRAIVPFFGRDDFVYRELRERSAVESGLVFLATMLAPLHDVRLSLTESQSRQWVSHAREIAQRSPVGEALVQRFLTRPGPGFSLAPAVASEALARLDEFRPARRAVAQSEAASPALPRPDTARPSRSRRTSPSRAGQSAPAEAGRPVDADPERRPRGPLPRPPARLPAPAHAQPDLFDELDA